ncbi:cilia- and flagella-associated protein 263 [Phascolarctos cinereus]|uniref:Cilia- and flagella-associated protein 263 n=1 Tax=Phascolarctos cinereus TaxID=38626 RepID=A0A6P5IKV3_PHACI|nr:coiled-coil domain-containing protein 113 [Phascolarctos cinereus]
MTSGGGEEETDSLPTSDSQFGEGVELPTIQLCGLVEELSYGNSSLKVETEMFEKYYNKLEPRDQRFPRASDFKTATMDFAQLRSRRKSKIRVPAEHLVLLTVDQKCDLALRELEDIKEEMRQLKANSERELHRHEAIIEEAEIRGADIKKAMQEFQREILNTISRKRGSAVATQRVLKYVEDQNILRDALKDKLRLKNLSLKVQKKKILMQLRQKEEVGEALHDADFQQLKIENIQFLENIDQRNRELIQLKLTAGNALHLLNLYKGKLQRATETTNHVVKEIALRKDIVEKIEKETLQAEEDRAKAEALNKKLRKQLATYKVPHVMMYVHEKVTNYELEKSIQTWERKVEIAEMSLKGYQKAWNRVKMANNLLETSVVL